MVKRKSYIFGFQTAKEHSNENVKNHYNEKKSKSDLPQLVLFSIIKGYLCHLFASQINSHILYCLFSLLKPPKTVWPWAMILSFQVLFIPEPYIHLSMQHTNLWIKTEVLLYFSIHAIITTYYIAFLVIVNTGLRMTFALFWQIWIRLYLKSRV